MTRSEFTGRTQILSSPLLVILEILGDVAPDSREYQRYASIVGGHSKNDPELRAEYEHIAKEVRPTKESTLQVAERHFNAPTDEIKGTIESADAKGIRLSEYPGRVFLFSSVGSSMADITAQALGELICSEVAG